MEKVKILVVDDESRMRKLVRDFLEREGFQVLVAGVPGGAPVLPGAHHHAHGTG